MWEPKLPGLPCNRAGAVGPGRRGPAESVLLGTMGCVAGRPPESNEKETLLGWTIGGSTLLREITDLSCSEPSEVCQLERSEVGVEVRDPEEGKG